MEHHSSTDTFFQPYEKDETLTKNIIRAKRICDELWEKEETNFWKIKDNTTSTNHNQFKFCERFYWKKICDYNEKSKLLENFIKTLFNICGITLIYFKDLFSQISPVTCEFLKMSPFIVYICRKLIVIEIATKRNYNCSLY